MDASISTLDPFEQMSDTMEVTILGSLPPGTAAVLCSVFVSCFLIRRVCAFDFWLFVINFWSKFE